jgi:hypothetical protein
MNERQRIALIKSASTSPDRPRVFRQHGCSLQDFIENVAHATESSHKVGALVLDYFCLDEARAFNGNIAGFQLAVEFLDEMLVGPTPSAAHFSGLKSVLDGRPDFETILAWVRDNYS